MSLKFKMVTLAATAAAATTLGLGLTAAGAGAVSIVTVTPNPIPYVDAANGGGALTTTSSPGNYETITINIPANSTLLPNATTTIEECQTQVLTSQKTTDCDPLTGAQTDINGDTITTGPDGSLAVQFPVNALPTVGGGFDPHSTIQVDSTHPLVLAIGNPPAGLSNVLTNTVFSDPIPLTDNSGSQVPEAPFAILLPLGAAALLGGGFLVSRRRRAARAAA